MGWYQVDAYLHLLLSVFLTGYTLFWMVMAVALRQRFDQPQTAQYLEVVGRARWPHVLVPWRLRLPLPTVGWIFLALLVVTGGLAGLAAGSAAVSRMAPVLLVKLVLVLLLILAHLRLAQRPRPSFCYAGLALTLAIVAVSTTLLR
jgi:hypothetical protein